MRTPHALQRLLAVAAIVQFSALAGAQTDGTAAAHDTTAVFRGVVIDAATARPVGAAEAWLVSSDLRTQTDSSRTFLLGGVSAGMQILQVRRIGFAALRDTITIIARTETVRNFALTSSVTQLDTVRTMAGQQKYLSPMLRAFETRRVSGQGGHFISDSVLRRNESSTLLNTVASRIPGVTQVMGKFLVSSRTQCRGGAAFLSAPKSNCKATGRSDCYVTIVLDGTVFYTAQLAEQGIAPPDLTKAIDISSLAGVEFYAGGASAPIDLRVADQECGTLWLWTREK
ncbi:MAG TPA: hypothetical protein VII52_14690 [Gemmatimonadaceae bacterium]